MSTQEGIIRSVYDNQIDCIRAIQQLYLLDGLWLDATYSKGIFYRGQDFEPLMRMDIAPQDSDTIQADSTDIPLPDESVASVMFDPPFVLGKANRKEPGIICTRFGEFKTAEDLWLYYGASLREFYRILYTDGVLVFKCQDTINSSINYFSHVWVMNEAVRVGFYPKDLFILVAKNRLIQHNLKTQQHARKYHSYFWIFVKEKCKVKYEAGEDME